MATWEKEEVPAIHLTVFGTGADDTTAHTVKLQPANQAYDSGAISCTAGTSNGSYYYADSDLDDETLYHIYVDDTFYSPLIDQKSFPAIGG